MTLQLKVPNMACASCGDTIARAVKKIDPDAIVRADLASERVEIETRASETEVKQAIVAAGYTAETDTVIAPQTPAGDRNREDLNQDLAV